MNFLKELILVSLNEPDSNLQWLAEFYGKKGLKFFTRSRGEPPPSFYIEKIGQFASLLGRGSGQVCDAAIYIIIYFELELGNARWPRALPLGRLQNTSVQFSNKPNRH